jgi:hypothetical protein
MKRIRIPWLVDIVFSEDAAEIESFAQDPKLDRAYLNRSILLNGYVLRRVRRSLQLGGKPFPTVAPRTAEGRATAQDALWRRLNELAPAFSIGSDELESLAAFVRGEGSTEACGPLVQQMVGRLFASSFEATPASWKAALVLDKSPRTMNPILLAWWAATRRVYRAKQLLSDMVGGDLAGVHAIGVALHNIVRGVNLMQQLYSDPVKRTALSPEMAGSQCLFAPATVIRQPIASESSAKVELEAGTLVILSLQAANAKSPGKSVVFMQKAWSRCPAEQWVPALLEGIWRRACRLPPQSQWIGNSGGCPFPPPQSPR